MREQIQIIMDEEDIKLEEYLKSQNIQKLMLICGSSVERLRIRRCLARIEARTGIKIVRFQNFSPNPDYESIVFGVKMFRREGCEWILAIGGGSAIDVAKCIKLFANMDLSQDLLQQEIVPNTVGLIAVPTTAGSGSEATRFAVIYKQGEKVSVSHESCIPQAVFFDESVLDSLPLYHRKATFLDALCHAMESAWSVHSTKESRDYSMEAIEILLCVAGPYLQEPVSENAVESVDRQSIHRRLLYAANLAGKAINISQTTAGHAMCYQLTKGFGIAHGHAAALCVAELLPHMIANESRCRDPRGSAHLQTVLCSLAKSFGCEGEAALCHAFQELLVRMKMDKGCLSDYLHKGCEQGSSVNPPFAIDRDTERKNAGRIDSERIEFLKTSVNPERLGNHPVELDEVTIEKIYRDILCHGSAK